MMMKTKFIKIDGQKIAFYESRKNGKEVVFIHGNSLSSHTFSKQFEDPRLNLHYRLIALDLPGHGLSPKANEPEKTYSLPGFISILLEFVDKLKLHDAVFVGHSLGGNIILDAATTLLSAKGFVIFGAPPINIPPNMGKYFLPNPFFPLAYKPDLTNDEIKDLASAFVKKNIEIPDVIIEDIKKTHPEMRAYLGASLIPENLTNEVEIIENIGKPVAIFHGKNDQLVNGEYFKELNIPTLWQKEIKIIPDSGHCPQLENPEMFNNILLNFLNEL